MNNRFLICIMHLRTYIALFVFGDDFEGHIHLSVGVCPCRLVTSREVPWRRWPWHRHLHLSLFRHSLKGYNNIEMMNQFLQCIIYIDHWTRDDSYYYLPFCNLNGELFWGHVDGSISFRVQMILFIVAATVQYGWYLRLNNIYEE